VDFIGVSSAPIYIAGGVWGRFVFAIREGLDCETLMAVIQQPDNPASPRRLRRKLIGGVLAVTLSLSAVLTLVLGNASLQRYRLLEENVMRQRVIQAVCGLSQLQNSQDVLAQDWTNWDDAYSYVQSPQSEFVASNLGEVTFETAGVDLIAFMDADGNVLAAHGYDLPGHQPGWIADATPIVLELIDAHPTIAPSLQDESPQNIDGIVTYAGEPWMLSSHGVVKTDGTGPAMGRFLFATRIDQQVISELSDMLQLDISIDPAQQSQGDDIWFETDGLSTIRSTSNLDRMIGDPANSLSVTSEREIFQAGLRGLITVACACLGGGLVIALFLGVLLDRLLVSRIERLMAQAHQIGSKRHKAERFEVVGNDEITALTESMNVMLANMYLSRQEFERTQHALDMAGTAIFWLTPEGTFSYVNAAACEMSGYETHELIGEKLGMFDPNWTSEHWSQNWNWFRRMDPRVFDTVCRRKNGEVFEAEVRCSRMFVNDEEFLFAILSDISERKAAERRLVELASIDQLTGLPNRAWLLNRLNRCISDEHQGGAALLFMDLDRFKMINDALGHNAGDRVLSLFASRVKELIQGMTPVFGASLQVQAVRLGGDEFVVLIEQEGTAKDTASAAYHLATEITQILKQPFKVNGQSLFSTASVGIVDDFSSYDNAEHVLRDADIAMYAAKHEGRNTIRRFNHEMHDEVLLRLQLERELHEATSKRDFELHYQPIIDIQTNKVHGFEALLRWKRPDASPVSPDVFVPIAEETGLIQEIGVFVIEQACQQLATWQNQYPGRELTMAVNVSRRQLLLPGLIDTIQRVLNETGVNPQSLEFEITEGVLIEDFDAASQTLEQLRSMGIRLSMDDFGTGYSSLSCLHEFPTQVLKIDRSFIANMSMNIEYASVTHAIITLARNLGMQVIAEGIEDSGQLAQLQALECDFGQGYFFSRPMPADQADQWLAEQFNKQSTRSKSA
jgi:diguanylate cyclase (GGDEF)-like protein/PAS domain S-box-containing protein